MKGMEIFRNQKETWMANIRVPFFPGPALTFFFPPRQRIQRGKNGTGANHLPRGFPGGARNVNTLHTENA